MGNIVQAFVTAMRRFKVGDTASKADIDSESAGAMRFDDWVRGGFISEEPGETPPANDPPPPSLESDED